MQRLVHADVAFQIGCLEIRHDGDVVGGVVVLGLLRTEFDVRIHTYLLFLVLRFLLHAVEASHIRVELEHVVGVRNEVPTVSVVLLAVNRTIGENAPAFVVGIVDSVHHVRVQRAWISTLHRVGHTLVVVVLRLKTFVVVAVPHPVRHASCDVQIVVGDHRVGGVRQIHVFVNMRTFAHGFVVVDVDVVTHVLTRIRVVDQIGRQQRILKLELALITVDLLEVFLHFGDKTWIDGRIARDLLQFRLKTLVVVSHVSLTRAFSRVTYTFENTKTFDRVRSILKT